MSTKQHKALGALFSDRFMGNLTIGLDMQNFGHFIRRLDKIKGVPTLTDLSVDLLQFSGILCIRKVDQSKYSLLCYLKMFHLAPSP